MILLLVAALAASPPSWSTLAEHDLKAMHAEILASHPGPVDVQNPGFRRWLDQGLAAALPLAKRATDFAGYEFALRRYQAGFRDGHLGLVFDAAPTPPRWPGFLASLRDGTFRVLVSSEPAVPVGSELLECDGRSPRSLMQARLFPFYGNPELEASWMRLAPDLLVDRGNPSVPPLKRCRVRTPDGRWQSVELRYRAIAAAELDPKLMQAAFGTPPAFGVRAFSDGGVWISIPTFGGKDAEAPLQALAAQAAQWRKASLIVFDLRGNDGGNSQYGSDLLEGLYGKDYLEAVVEPELDKKGEYIEWRVSKENSAYLSGLVKEVAKTFGAHSEATREFRQVAVGMKRALKRGAALLREDEPKPPARPVPPSPVHSRVYALTDGRCASACLDFVDQVVTLPTGRVIGWPTSADSTYLELRPAPLPSGHATLRLAIKVYRNRLRGNNAPYVPNMRFHGELSDTPAVEKWVLHLATLPIEDQ